MAASIGHITDGFIQSSSATLELIGTEDSAVFSSSSLSSPVVAQTTSSPSISSLATVSSTLSSVVSKTTTTFPSTSSLATVSSTLSSVVSKATTTFPSTFNKKPEGHGAQQKIAIGVVVPTVVIAIILFVLWAWRKFHRRNRSTVDEKRPATPPEEIQPYLQQKAELEDEARRMHELEAQEKRYEKDGNQIYEFPERHSRHEMPERHSGRSVKN